MRDAIARARESRPLAHNRAPPRVGGRNDVQAAFELFGRAEGDHGRRESVRVVVHRMLAPLFGQVPPHERLAQARRGRSEPSAHERREAALDGPRDQRPQCRVEHRAAVHDVRLKRRPPVDGVGSRVETQAVVGLAVGGTGARRNEPDDALGLSG